MTHLEFIEKLKTIPLQDEEYARVGLSKDFISEYKEKYHSVNRRVPVDSSSSESTDPIISLLKEFNLKNIKVGMVEFNSKTKNIPDFLLFGKFDMDELAINYVSKEIVLLEEATNNVMSYCASNSSNFLEAIIFIGTFLEKRGIDAVLYEDEKINLMVAEKTAEIAGGEKYLNFYRMMLGI